MEELRVRVPGLTGATGLYLHRCRKLITEIKKICEKQLGRELRLIVDSSDSRFDTMSCDLYVNVEVVRNPFYGIRKHRINEMGEKLLAAMITSSYGAGVLTLRHTYVEGETKYAFLERNFNSPEPEALEEEETKVND